MSSLPREIRKQLKNHISKTTDEAFDLAVNLTGKYIDEKKRRKLKTETEQEFGARIEETIARSYQIGLQLKEEYQQNSFETSSLKEKFYLMTDTLLQSFMPDIPKNVHAMDYLFRILEELLRDFRFSFNYQKETNYAAYLQALKELMVELEKQNKINKSWDVLNEFKDSKDAYLLVQATLQKLIKYYEFLERDFSKIENRQLDGYLEIYHELSGHFEKLIALIDVLIQLSTTDAAPKYEDARKRGVYENIRNIEKSGWGIFSSGFNRHVRNAIVHKTCKIDILKETVEFIDRNKTVTLTFREVQKATRELSAVLLILPNVFVSIFCLAILSIRDILGNLPKREAEQM